MLGLAGKVFLNARSWWIYPITPQKVEVIVEIAGSKFFAILEFVEEVTAPEAGTEAIVYVLGEGVSAVKSGAIGVGEDVHIFGGPGNAARLSVTEVVEGD